MNTPSPDTQLCGKCDKQIAKFFKTCPFCKNKVSTPMADSDSAERDIANPPTPPSRLVACPDCEHEISRSAVACPHCGAPNSVASTQPIVTSARSTSPRSKSISASSRAAVAGSKPVKDEASVSDMLTGFIVLVVIVFMLYQCVSDDEPKKPVELTADQIEKNNEFRALSEVRYDITSRLRDPDSYEVIDQGALTKPDGSIAVAVSYRAKNGFGGYTVNHAAYTCQSGSGGVSCAEVR